MKFYPLHQEVSILGPHLGLEGCPNLAEDNPVPMQQLKKVLPIFIKNTYLTLRSIVYKKIKVNQDDMEMIKKSWLFGLVKYWSCCKNIDKLFIKVTIIVSFMTFFIRANFVQTFPNTHWVVVQTFVNQTLQKYFNGSIFSYLV